MIRRGVGVLPPYAPTARFLTDTPRTNPEKWRKRGEEFVAKMNADSRAWQLANLRIIRESGGRVYLAETEALAAKITKAGGAVIDLPPVGDAEHLAGVDVVAVATRVSDEFGQSTPWVQKVVHVVEGSAKSVRFAEPPKKQAEQKEKAQPIMDQNLETPETLHDALVQERVNYYRADRAAKQHLLVEAWREPPQSSSLEIDLALPVDPIRYRIAGMLGVNHNATLTAQYKVGKTTLLGGLVRSLADGDDFLNSIEVQPPEGRIGFWNAEMDRDDYINYIRSTGIRNPQRVETAHLRGFNVPILTEQGRDWTVRWLRDQGVTLWINDSWSRLCAWSGVDENDNSEINRLCAAIDEIKARAGVSEFITTHHTGRKQHEMGAEHGRGAASLDAWVDSRWVMTREGDARFLMVEGRKMGLTGGTRELVFDPETGLSHLGTKDRTTARHEQHNGVVERLVTENPGIKTTDLLVKVRDAIPGKNNTAANNALKAARDSGVVYTVRGAANSLRYYPKGYHEEA